MLSWVVKVVPQPPELPAKTIQEQKEVKPDAAPPPEAAPPPVAQEKKVTFQDECRTEAPKADKPHQEAAAVDDNSPAGSQPGVLMWISTALPQPAASPRLSRANSTTKEENTTASKSEDQKGMIAWIAQGLEKVVPHPDLNRKETPAPEQPAEVHQQVPQAAAAKVAEIQVTAVEVGPDRGDNKPLPPRIVDWIKQGLEKMVPQPEIHIHSKTQVPEKTEAPPKAESPAPKPDPAPQPPPAPQPAADPEISSKEGEPQPNMMGWIVTEIGRRLPQPAQKDAASDQVHNRGK